MKVNEALRRILFKVGTTDDLSGRAVNPIINNRNIIDELNSQLRQYANITKGIQDVYTFPLNTNTPFVEAPPLALRSESYKSLILVSQGTLFMMDVRGPGDVLPRFRYNPMSGLTNWVMPWSTEVNGTYKTYLGMFPMKNADAQTTTLNGALTSTATTITVASTSGFIQNSGRLTIDSEKIMFTYLDSTHFYGCVRGVENTTAATHLTAATVTENNVWLFYSRLHNEIVVRDDNTVDLSVKSQDIEVVEEHMEGIIKLVAYNILVKLDPERASVYKIEADDLYKQYAIDIRKGYGRNRQGSSVRSQIPFHESGIPFGTNLIY